MSAHDDLVERIIAAGFRSVAREGHPDAGGDGRLDMDALVKARDALRQGAGSFFSRMRNDPHKFQRGYNAGFADGLQAGKAHACPHNADRKHLWVACGACTLNGDSGDVEPCRLFGPTTVYAATEAAILCPVEWRDAENNRHEDNLWFPRSQLAACCTLTQKDDWGMLIASSWIVRTKNLVTPRRRR